MELSITEQNGLGVVEGAPDEPFLAGVQDVNRVIEVCLGEGLDAALLYAANLPPGFFDLSTRVAGEMLQKLRNYRIRLAVVRPAGAGPVSSYFTEMEGEERRGGHFGVFETRAEALAWLGSNAAG